MNKQQLINKYKQLRRKFNGTESDSYYAYNFICVLLENYKTMKEMRDDVRYMTSYTTTQDGREIYNQFLLETMGEY